MLSRPPRRVVRRRGIPVPARCALFLLIPHVWVGGALLWAFINLSGLALFGQLRQAAVTSRDVQAEPGSDCEIDYVYNDRGGRHADHGTLRGDVYNLYPRGATIQIRAIRILGHSTSELASERSGVFTIVIVALFVTVWDGLLLRHFYSICLSPLTQRRLLREGEAVMGEITDKTMRGKKTGIYGLAYSFTDSDGKRLKNTMQVRRKDHEIANIGYEVLVFYDPRAPKRSVLYAYSDYAPREWQR